MCSAADKRTMQDMRPSIRDAQHQDTRTAVPEEVAHGERSFNVEFKTTICHRRWYVSFPIQTDVKVTK